MHYDRRGDSRADEIERRAREAIDFGVETRNVEFKESWPFEEHRWKIVKTCMAMANLRDGGMIVVGVAEREGRWWADGMKPEHVATYKQDIVFELVNRHARPAISLVARPVTHEGKEFVAIDVAEFDRVPIICGLETPPAVVGSQALRVGDMPGRTRDRIATSRTQDVDLVAEILEVAAEKRAAGIIAQGKRVGLVAPPEGLATQFEAERLDFGDFD